MAEKTTGIPLTLSSFTDDLPDLSRMSAGDVIGMYHKQESKRRRNDDEYSQSDVPVSFRSVPEGLLEVLDEAVSASGFRRSTITKCLSHHAMAWYQAFPQVDLLSRIYRSTRTHSDGFPDVVRRIKRDDYEFVHPRPVSERGGIAVLRTVAFILGYFSDLSDTLGIPSYKLLLTGLCWSLSTNTDGWAESTVSKFLVPEAENVQLYLNERLLVLDFADKVVRLRRGDQGVVDYVKGLGDRL